MIKNIFLLGFTSILLFTSFIANSSVGDTITYQKACSDYVRLAIKIDDKLYKIIEKNGNRTLLESEIESPKITYEMLSSDLFRRSVLRGSRVVRLYNYDGQMRFETSRMKKDSVVLKVYDDLELTHEYLFISQRMDKIMSKLDLEKKSEELSKKILGLRAARITEYANGSVFCTYTQQRDRYSSYYTQLIIKDEQTIQKNILALGFSTSPDDPDTKNYKLFPSLSGFTKYKDQFSFPHVEYYPDYSIKTRQNLVGHILTNVSFSDKGKILDTTFSLYKNNMNNDIALLHAESYDDEQNELFYYHTEYTKDKVTVTWRTKVRDSLITIKKEISPETWYRNMGAQFPERYRDTPQVNNKNYYTKIYYKKKVLQSYPTSIGTLAYGRNQLLTLSNLFSYEEQYTRSPFIQQAKPQNRSNYIRADYLLRGNRMPKTIKKDTIGKLSEYQNNQYTGSSYRDENLKIKKDFVSCLFGVWSQSTASYEIPCEYMEIQKINSSYYQVTNDFNDYQIVNLKNEVVFEAQEKPNVRQHRDYYVVRVSDSTTVFDNKWELVYKTQKNYTYYDITSTGNSLIAYEKDANISRVFSKNEDSVSMTTLQGKLSFTQLKANNKIKSLAYNIHTVFQLLPEGPKQIFQTTDSLSTVRINYNSILVSASKDIITVYGLDNDHLTKYNLRIDDFHNWKNTLDREEDYSYRNRENSGLLIYEHAGKKGMLSSTLYPILSPEWDDISLKYKILKKAENLYLFDNYGNTALLPSKMVKLENKKNQYLERDNTTLVYYDDNTVALPKSKYKFNFPVQIQTVGRFSKSFDNTENYEKSIAIITTDGDLYINRGSLFTKDQSATGTFQDAESGQSIIYSNGKKIGTSYDKVYQVGQMEYLNPLLTAAVQVKATDGTNTYKIDLNDATITQLNSLGGKEKEIGGHVLGYDKNYKLYHNDCDKIRYFPDTLKRFEVPTSQNTNFVLAYNHTATQYRSYSERLYPYLYSLKTQKLSTYKVKRLTEIGPNILVTTPTHERVISQDMNEILPFSGMQQVVYRDNFYFFKKTKRWFRYHLADEILDTLNGELKYADQEKYVSLAEGEMNIYTYENKLLSQSKKGFLDKLKEIEKIDVDYPEAIKNTISRYKLDRLQEAWVKSIFWASRGVQPETPLDIKSAVFPTREYYQEQMDKSSTGKKDIFSDGYGSSGDYFGDEMFEMYDGDYGSSKYGDYKTECAKMKDAFESKLSTMKFGIADFKYMQNGLLAFDNTTRSYSSNEDYELYIKLQDEGYQLWTFQNIFNESKLDSLQKYLLHKISLNPSFWGVTCNEDMEKYDLNFFAARFKITKDCFTILPVNYDYFRSEKMKLSYSDLKYFMTTEAQTSFASIFLE